MSKHLRNATTVNQRQRNSVEFSQVPHEDPIRFKASRRQLLNPALQTQLFGRGQREDADLVAAENKLFPETTQE